MNKTRLQAGDFLQIEFRKGEAPQMRFFRPNLDGCLRADNEGDRTLLPRPSEGVSNTAHVATILYAIAGVTGLRTSKLDRAEFNGGEIFKVEMLES
ncbi:MAG: hypothetical protein EXS52_02545 [Candidatus Staskawiczbacteria bacterium]|nr:hypothetical protein [Candidatus Staskawiczbacteria bacterium]